MFLPAIFLNGYFINKSIDYIYIKKKYRGQWSSLKLIVYMYIFIIAENITTIIRL